MFGLTTRPIRLSAQERDEIARNAANRKKAERYTIVAKDLHRGYVTTYPPVGDWTCRKI